MAATSTPPAPSAEAQVAAHKRLTAGIRDARKAYREQAAPLRKQLAALAVECDKTIADLYHEFSAGTGQTA